MSSNTRSITFDSPRDAIEFLRGYLSTDDETVHHALDVVAALTAERSAGAAPIDMEVLDALNAQAEMLACYRIGKRPSERLIDRVGKAHHLRARLAEGTAPIDARADVQHALDALNAAMDNIRDGDSPEGDLLEAHSRLDSLLTPPKGEWR